MVEKGVIKAHSRHTLRNMRKAIQGNVIKALIELITNSDDSYIRLEDGETDKHSKKIEIEFYKDANVGKFIVRDFAEGMTTETLKESFQSYGASTSGMKTGMKVRGYFGQGAKDALCLMKDARICTIKDNKFVECRLFIEGENPTYTIEEVIQATPEIRKEHGIEENGTVVYFEINRDEGFSIPQFDTVHEKLTNSYILRKIMTSEIRKVFLINGNTKKKDRIRKDMPKGTTVADKSFSIKDKKGRQFNIKVLLKRADDDLSQTGEDRTGGLLILDEYGAVLDCSLYRYDNEDLATKLFGEVNIEGFRQLLIAEKEEAVLRDERDGLDRNHEFSKMFIKKIEEIIGEEVKKEEERRKKATKAEFTKEERERYKKALKFLNDIAKDEIDDSINLADDISDTQEPPNGFCIYPETANISLGKKYTLKLVVNPTIIKVGTKIKLISNNNNIKFNSNMGFKVEKPQGGKLFIRYLQIEAIGEGETVIVASAGQVTAETKINIGPERTLMLDEGMVFNPESITARPNQRRKVKLHIYVKIIPDGSKILIKSDNAAINLSENEIIVNDSEATRHVFSYTLELWGEGEGKAIITAEYPEMDKIALLNVEIKSKPDSEDDNKGGMFKDPDFNHEENPYQRTSYSQETGRITIYVNFPSVKHYLGSECQYKQTLPAQVFLADIIAERCFYEIARKRTEAKGTLISPTAKEDEIRKEAYRMSKQYGQKIHEAFVDKSLFEESRKGIK